MFKKITKFISRLIKPIGRFFRKKKQAPNQSPEGDASRPYGAGKYGTGHAPEQPEQNKEAPQKEAAQHPEKIQEHTEKKNKRLIFPY